MPKKRKRKAKRGDSGLFQLVTSGVALGGAAVVAYLLFRPSAAAASTDRPEAELDHDRSYPLTAKLYAYWPATTEAELAEEGGNVDRRDTPLYDLDDYLNGKAPYVSVAADFQEFKYGERITIRELDELYGRRIDFRVVDSLHADSTRAGKGSSTRRLDIRVSSRRAGLAEALNSWVHYRRLDPPRGAVIAEVG